MSEWTSSLWNVRPGIRPKRREPFLCLQHLTLFVADQERSLKFFVDGLGFNLVLDYRTPADVFPWTFEQRWLAIAPPDGTARIALVTPLPDSDERSMIGRARQIVFLTEDVEAKYREWSGRGVRFVHPPKVAPFGSLITRFQDPDGNEFSLIEFDQATRQVEEQREREEKQQEFERRSAMEMEIARQVQARLFPQSMPPARTLEYAGICIQARQVGGDYYDFLDLGRERLGLVIGDIAGKGIAAALLMANLQANLRSQCVIASEQPGRFLRSVNQLFCRNTADGDYATFFFSDYDDATGNLRFANCGHLPAFLLRREGELERLDATSTVLGLFEEWDCDLQERQLFAGDTLLLYTDGVTESRGASEDEFGEARLIEALRRHSGLSAEALVLALVDEVRKFNPREQQDDITLIAAKCRQDARA